MKAEPGLATSLHGVLVSIDDVGVFISGEAGSGKSSLALALVAKGHRLIADDVVEIERFGVEVIGRSPDRFKGLVATREVGIVDIRQLVGEGACGNESRIDACVELVRGTAPHLMGLTAISPKELLGVAIPAFTLPLTGRMQFEWNPTVRENVLLAGASVESAVFAAHDDLLGSARP